MMSQVMDKENPGPVRGKDEVSSLRLPGTPLRTPLQAVNIPRAANLRKSLYTQITPCGTPTPVGQPMPDTPRPVCTKPSKVKAEGDVHLNVLIYQKINDIISEKEREHKKLVAEKDVQIAALQQKLEQQEDVHESRPASSDSVDEYVSCVIQGAVRTLLSDKAGDVSGDDSLSLDPHLMLDMCDDSFVVLDQGASPSGAALPQRSSGMRASDKLCPGPVKQMPRVPRIVVTEEEAGGTGDPDMLDTVTMGANEQAENVDTETMCSPVKTAETETMYTPVKTSEAGTMFTPAKTDENLAMCLPIRTCDTDTMCIPDTTESGTMCTPVKTAESGTMCTTVMTAESETMCTPIKTVEMETMMSPITTAESETMCTPVKLVNSDTMYTPIKHADADTMLTPIKLIEAGTMSSPVPTADHDTSCSDLPSPEKSPRTPLRVCCDTAVGTSPFMPALPRPSELEFRSMSPTEFSSYLETATISNSLLRSELTSLQRERQSMCQRLGDLQAQLAGTEHQKQQALQEASAEAGEKFSSLQQRQKSQMDEIAELQEKIAAMDAEMAEVNTQHHTTVARLRHENTDLQKDLQRAYKLHKQEMTAREAEWRSQDYQPYYEQAQRRIRMLQAQLDPFYKLQETLDISCQLQDDLQKHLDDTYTMLTSQSEQLITQKKLFLEQHNAWQKDKKSKDKEVAEMIEGTERLKTQFSSLIERAEVAESGLGKLQEQHESTIDELKCSKDLVQNLSTQVEELHMAQAEVSDALQSSEERASLAQSQEQLLEGELERLQTELDAATAQMKNISKVNQALEKSLSVTQAKHEELSQSEASLRTELNSAIQQKQEAMSNMAYLQGQLQRLQVSQTELAHLRQQVKNLSQTSKETEDFLGEERRLLGEELAETQANLSVKSMELSRVTAELENQKMAYEEEQFAQQQLRCEMQEIQEELDHTKVQAHYMLLQQGTELSDAIVATDSLHSTLQTLSIQLAAKVEAWTTSTNPPMESPESSFSLGHSHQEAPGSPKSLENEADNENMGTSSTMPESRSAFRQVGATGFRPSISNQSPEAGEDKATKTDVCDRILEALELLESVVTDIKRLQNAVSGHMAGLQEEVAELQEKLQTEGERSMSKETHRQQLIETLRAHLAQQQVTEQELRDQLASLRQQQGEMDDEMMAQCKQQAALEQRVELINLEQANKKLSREVTSLTSSLQHKEAEVQVIQASLDDTLASLKGSEGAHLVISIKENVGLKKEVKSLRMLNLKLKHDMNELSTTATRRMQRYQHNWQTAESEVSQLDDLFDQIRQLLMNHASEVRTWSDVRKLYALGLLDKSDSDSPDGHQSSEPSNKSR